MIFPDEMYIEHAICQYCKRPFSVDPFSVYYRSVPEYCPNCTSRYLIMNAIYDAFVSTDDEEPDFKFPAMTVIDYARGIHNFGSIEGIKELLESEEFNTLNLTFVYDLQGNFLAPAENARKLIIQQFNCDDIAKVHVRILSPKSFHFAEGIVDLTPDTLNFIYNLADVTYETLYLCYMTDKRPIKDE